ncbi:hypothetical protein, partial [Rhizobium leguminosarum]|uniref:hypothetical protein n=1 Tax=Rhizobium leguminosarum TaxID=384 RepID=UPI003F9C66FE
CFFIRPSFNGPDSNPFWRKFAVAGHELSKGGGSLKAPARHHQRPCMDGLRVARGKLVFLADWSGAGMYSAFDCGVFMPLALM